MIFKPLGSTELKRDTIARWKSLYGLKRNISKHSLLLQPQMQEKKNGALPRKEQL